MIKHFFLIAAAFATVNGFAQKKADPAVFAKTITASDLKKHLSIIASAEMEGRDTPSPGLEKAAEYITSQFKSFGLKPGNNGSFRQTFQLSKDSLKELSLTINDAKFQQFADIAPLFGGDKNVNLKFTEYAFAGYGIVDKDRNDYASIDVKNKLVVIFPGAPQGFTPSKTGRMASTAPMMKIRTAMEKGAAAVLVITEAIPAQFVRKISYRPAWEKQDGQSQPPVYFISKAVVEKTTGYSFDEVKNSLEAGQTQPNITQSAIAINYDLRKQVASASNILGVVEGSDKKDEYVFVTAHYDHVGKDANGNIFYGADDDGSGTVGVIEMAQAFAAAKKAGKGPRRTMVFMTVSGEEKGLWGSEYYSENPIFPLAKTTVDLNIDMIGRTDTIHEKMADSINYVYVIGDDKLSSDLTPITETVNSKYTKLVLDRKYNDPNDPERIYYRSDHYNFARKGIPVLFYFDGIHRDYHQITDTVDKINFELLAKRAQLVFYTAWDMANRDDMLNRDRKLPEGGR